MYTALGWLSCKNCNPSVSPLAQVSRKVEGNESRGEAEAEEERGSRGVEKWGIVQEAKGNLARGFGNFITVYSDLLWFLSAGRVSNSRHHRYQEPCWPRLGLTGGFRCILYVRSTQQGSATRKSVVKVSGVHV